MHVLISGGAGYIGSMLTIGLLSEGHRVTVLDHFNHRQNSLAVCCANENFTAVRGDVRNMGLIKALLAQADVVIPLAAVVGAPACDADPTAAVTINREAIKMLCQFASKEQRIVIPITNSGYGVGEQGVECTEDSPLKPISLYGKTKVEAESIALARENSISLRLATVFGMSPRMRLDLLVNDFVYKAIHERAILLFEARFKRNYLHVRDAARAFVHAIDNFDAMKGRPYNVGLSDANLSKWELCEHIQKRVPWLYFCEAPIGEDPDKRDYLISNRRIEATGFKTAFSLDAGIVELIKGYATIRNGSYGNV